MTRSRMFGEDKDFCAWMRKQKLLPSHSRDCGFVASDVDVNVHRYMTAVDSVGTREVQGLMLLEVKTRGGVVHASQADTLFKIHAFRGQKNLGGQVVRNFGVAFVFLTGTDPDNSASIEWGRFAMDRRIVRTAINVQLLISLLRFEVHPETLTPRPFRRHHKTREIVEEEQTALGFTVEKKIRQQS